MDFIAIIAITSVLFFFIAYLLRSNKLLLILFIIIFPILIRTFIAQAYKIPAGSMVPTMLIGDHILTNKYIYKFTEPSLGDLVIFPYPKDPRKDFIKRIVAISGDTLEIKNKVIFRNGSRISEPYVVHLDKTVFPPSATSRDSLGPLIIPEDSLFVMGDNRDNSHDSRFWGFVKKKSVKAKVQLIYWSWDKKRDQVRWDRIGKIVQ